MNWPVIATCATLLAVLGPAASASAEDPGPVLTFQDPRITESSNLLDLGSTMVTTNDSGGRPQLFVVGSASGRTVGVTDFGAPVVDVEALAPAGRSAVWVGDIGDNRSSRPFVTVYRVGLGAGERTVRPAAYRVVYPDRRGHDAESLFADERGRLYVVTKTFFGGTVFRAPAQLSRSGNNQLRAVGEVRELATDAAMMQDGRHLLVRSYDSVGVYDFPSLKRIGQFTLPAQRQGEGISVGPGDRIRLSSEGVHSTVRQVTLPAALARAVDQPRTPSPSATPSATPSPSSAVTPSPEAAGSPQAVSPTDSVSDGRPFKRSWLLWSIAGVVALGAVGIGVGLRRRSD